MSNASGKLLLTHILHNFKESSYDLSKPIDFSELIEEYELNAISDINPTELKEICISVITEIANDRMIEDIRSGKKKNSLKFLVGQAMRLSQGRIKPQQFESMFKEVIGVTW